MNKEEFLRTLREKLSILDEKEMEDILSEYEQHIDMKTAGAMTEEEAIADFGDPDDLAADILEAYHVRSDYARENTSKNGKEGLKEWAADLGERVKSRLNTLQNRCVESFKNFCTFWKRILEQRFGESRKEKTDRNHEDKTDAEVFCGERVKAERTRTAAGAESRKGDFACRMERRGFFGTLWHGLSSGIRGFAAACRKFLEWCIKIGIWCAKWMWNVGWIMVGGMMGIGACFCLFGLGVLLMLSVQGYPVSGVTISMAGVSLCAVSLTGLPFTFLIGAGKKSRKKEKDQVIILKAEEEEHA